MINSNNNRQQLDPLVVGIALVVEEVGKGSRLVFKYPLVPPPPSPSSSSPSPANRNEFHHHRARDNDVNARTSTYHSTNASTSTSNDTNDNNSTNNNSTNNQQNIFFRLKSRILSKLFRTKPPLCGQPVSLNIEGTIFCCRSVLLNPNHTQQHHHHQSHHQQQHTSGAGGSNIHQDDVSINSKFSLSGTIHSHSYHNTSMNQIGTGNANNNANTNANANANNGASESNIDGLVLFSIIVAMKPMYKEDILKKTSLNNEYMLHRNITSTASFTSASSAPSIPSITKNKHHHKNNTSSSTSNNNHNSYNHNTKNNNNKQSNNSNNSNNNIHHNQNKNDNYTDNRINEHGSLHFPAVRRIHLTLSRLCQVLEREEKRCLYVSRQVSHLMKVAKHQYENNDNDNSNDTDSSNNNGNGNSNDNRTKITKTVDNNSSTGSDSGAGAGSNTNTNGNGTSNDVVKSLSTTIMRDDNPIGNAIYMYSTDQEQQQQQHHHQLNQQQQKQQQWRLQEEERRERLDRMLDAPPPPILTNEGMDGSRSSSTNGIVDDEIMFSRYKERIPIYGNLALELAQIYHALCRNSNDILPSPDLLLSGRNEIVYINLHLAVRVEAATATASISNIPSQNYFSSHRPYLRRYHTLLFHPVSAAELLRHKLKKSSKIDNNSNNNNGNILKGQQPQQQRIPGPALRRMEKLLLVADDPFKSLSDMASDAALSLPAIFEAATSLLESGVCIAVPVMSTSTKFGCSNNAVELIASLKLEFAQQFGHYLSIFMVVSALTTTVKKVNKTNDNNLNESYDDDGGKEFLMLSIGEIIQYSKLVMRTIKSDDNDQSSSSTSTNEEELEDRIPPVIRMLTHRIWNTVRSARIPPGFVASTSGYGIDVNNTNHSQIVKNALISMITWLRARSIIIEQKEYLASVMSLKDNDSTSIKSPRIEGQKFRFRGNESLFRDFVSQKYQSCGNVSIGALAWEYDVNLRIIEGFRDWGLREKKISSVIRIHQQDRDDWGAP